MGDAGEPRGAAAYLSSLTRGGASNSAHPAFKDLRSTVGARRRYPRPALSAPKPALLAAGLLFLAWGSAAPVSALALGAALKTDDLLGANFPALVALSSIPFLAVALGCRAGAVWAIFLFRILAAIALLLAMIDLIGGVLISVGVVGFEPGTSQNTGVYICICAGVFLSLSLALIWSIHRVRWLDPYSRPDEWETPVNRASQRPV